MKKTMEWNNLLKRRLRKLLCVMTLKTLLLVGTFTTVCAGVHSQVQKLSVSFENTSIEQVLDYLQKNTDFVFVYQKEAVGKVRVERIKLEKATLEEVLEAVLPTHGLDYKIAGRVIAVKRAEQQTQALAEARLTGIVTDASQTPLPGATVIVLAGKGGTPLIGTTTDPKGQYRLMVPAGVKGLLIRFTFVGMKSFEEKYTGQQTLDVVMEEEKKTIDEVVVTGYLNIRKSSFTGNATTVTRDELLKTNNKNVISALQVFDPSFRIKENTMWGSDPNALPEFNIRGESSIGMNKGLDVEQMKQTQRTTLKDNPNLPVFIMDGFEVSVQKIYDMDINRIESITILKDAAATAMYGSRAANGVVVVTTVAPTPGQLRVTYNFTGGSVFPDLSDYNLCNAAEKLEVERLSGLFSSTDKAVLETSDEEYNTILQKVLRGVNTDWLAQPLRNVFNHTHSLYVEGGVESIRYAVDFNYDSNNGAMKGSYRSRLGAGLSLDYRYKKLQVRNYVSYNTTRKQDSPYGIFSDYARMQPYAAIRDDDGKLLEEVDGNRAFKTANPLWKALMLDSYSGRGSIDEMMDNLSVNLYLFNGFQFKGQFSITKTNGKTESFIDPKDVRYKSYPNDEKGELSGSLEDSYNWNVNAMFYYNRGFGKHFVNATAGVNVQESKKRTDATRLIGFQMGNMHSPAFAARQPDKTGTSSSKSRLIGVVASLNYSFNNVYLLDASFRMDGSSQFGSDKRFAPFWSVGGGINVHNYTWLNDNWWVNTWRIRASYGSTGKVNFPSYAAVTTYGTDMESWYYTGPASYLMALGNPELQWETTKTVDAGVELGLFGNALSLSASYYRKKTVDLIDKVSLRTSSGFETYSSNSGSMVNKGFEINLNATVYRDKKWVVSLNANIASNKNEITELGAASEAYNKALDENYDMDMMEALKNGTPYYRSLVNKPLQKYYVGASTTAVYAVRSAGIDPANGKEVYIKRNGTRTYTWCADDQVVVGDLNPDAQGSFGINIGYKGIYVNASFIYQWGGQAYNSTLVEKVENADVKNGNVDRRVLTERWKRVGDLVSYTSLGSTTITRPTSRFVQDYDYLKFSGLSVGYDFRQDWIRKWRLTSLGIRFNANDLAHWSTVMEERGTSYPYAKNYGFTLTVGF